MRVLAIDPGVAPCACLLMVEPNKPIAAQWWGDSDTSVILEVNKKPRREPSAQALARVIDEADPLTVFIEQVGPHPGEGVTSSFRFGRAFGICEAVPLVMQIPVELVHPRTWRRIMKVPPGKDGSRQAAGMLAPHLSGEFVKVKDHNKADAFLIAWFGYLELRKRHIGGHDE